jgi:hypothetical protein
MVATCTGPALHLVKATALLTAAAVATADTTGTAATAAVAGVRPCQQLLQDQGISWRSMMITRACSGKQIVSRCIGSFAKLLRASKALVALQKHLNRAWALTTGDIAEALWF